MWMVFILDDSADAAHKDDVQAMANIIIEALHNPHTPRPQNEWVGGEVARQ